MKKLRLLILALIILIGCNKKPAGKKTWKFSVKENNEIAKLKALETKVDSAKAPEFNSNSTLFYLAPKNTKGWCALRKQKPTLLFKKDNFDSIQNKKSLIKVYKVGKIVKGPYKGADYYIMTYEVFKPRKYDQFLVRFLKPDSATIVFLSNLFSQNSYKTLFNNNRLHIPFNLSTEPLFKDVEKVYGDASISISNLKIPKDLSEGNFVLVRQFYAPELNTTDKLRLIKNNLYATKGNSLKSASELLNRYDSDAEYSIDSASISDFLTMNGYYLITNDGVINIYAPDWERFTMKFNDSTTTKLYPNYDANGYYTKRGEPALYANVIDSAAFFRKFVPKKIGINSWGTTIYYVGNINSSFMDKFYSYYLRLYKLHRREANYRNHKYSYEEFIKEKPILFFKDDFGQWYVVYKRLFLPPKVQLRLLN